MGTVNTKKTHRPRKGSHLNYMNGPSYDVQDPFLNLHIAAASCFFGEPMFYQSKKPF